MIFAIVLLSAIAYVQCQCNANSVKGSVCYTSTQAKGTCEYVNSNQLTCVVAPSPTPPAPTQAPTQSPPTAYNTCANKQKNSVCYTSSQAKGTCQYTSNSNQLTCVVAPSPTPPASPTQSPPTAYDPCANKQKYETCYTSSQAKGTCQYVNNNQLTCVVSPSPTPPVPPTQSPPTSHNPCANKQEKDVCYTASQAKGVCLYLNNSNLLSCVVTNSPTPPVPPTQSPVPYNPCANKKSGDTCYLNTQQPGKCQTTQSSNQLTCVVSNNPTPPASPTNPAPPASPTQSPVPYNTCANKQAGDTCHLSTQQPGKCQTTQSSNQLTCVGTNVAPTADPSACQKTGQPCKLIVNGQVVNQLGVCVALQTTNSETVLTCAPNAQTTAETTTTAEITTGTTTTVKPEDSDTTITGSVTVTSNSQSSVKQIAAQIADALAANGLTQATVSEVREDPNEPGVYRFTVTASADANVNSSNVKESLQKSDQFEQVDVEQTSIVVDDPSFASQISIATSIFVVGFMALF